jgi:hypothetical protein
MVVRDLLITNVPTKSNGEFLLGVYSKAPLRSQKRTKIPDLIFHLFLLNLIHYLNFLFRFVPRE